MRNNRVYLLHPVEKYLPGVAEWIAAAEAFIREDPLWDDWDLHFTPYDDQNSFPVQPLHARVLNNLGPVVLLEKVQGKALNDLRERLRSRAVIVVATVTDDGGIYDQLVVARERFERKEPFLPRKFVVAVLIVRKLRKGNYWAGKEKGYLWHDDLAKGRGVDERYADIAHIVANDLLQHEILIYKTSQGAKKYALNPSKKPEIHAIADDRIFRNKKLEQILLKDREEVSAHELLESYDARQFEVAADGFPTFRATAVTEVVTFASECPDCPPYRVEVAFEGERYLREKISQKRILIQFFEAFQ